MIHKSSCSCGQLKLKYEGEITRTSICHCFECQKRTGSTYGVQTRLDSKFVTIEGQSTAFQRKGDSGGIATFHFCPKCGSTVYWEADGLPGNIIAAIGNFTNPELPSPTFMVYGDRKHHWVIMPETAIEYFD